MTSEEWLELQRNNDDADFTAGIMASSEALMGRIIDERTAAREALVKIVSGAPVQTFQPDDPWLECRYCSDCITYVPEHGESRELAHYNWCPARIAMEVLEQ